VTPGPAQRQIPTPPQASRISILHQNLHQFICGVKLHPLHAGARGVRNLCALGAKKRPQRHESVDAGIWPVPCINHGPEAAMKNIFFATSVLALGLAGAVWAQDTSTSPPQPMGRGRGGAPFAWNDKDRDGICDVTGKPVGQNRGAGAMRRGCCGRAAGAGSGRGRGRCCAGSQQAAPAPAR
jgi:hypothetical protein